MLWVKGNSPWRISVHNLFKISFKNFGFENTNLIGRLRLFLLLIHWLVVQTVKNLPAMWETWVQSLSLEYSMENKWQPTQILFPGELHGQRSLADYSPWGQKKLDTTEWLTLTEYWIQKSLWLCGSQQTVENCSRDGNTRPPYLPPEKPLCRWRNNN